MKFYKNSGFWLAFIMILMGMIYYSTVILNHYLFKTWAYDYANYNFAFWDYAHFHLSRVPTFTYTSVNFLQDHFSFMLMYLVPFYWLLNWLTGSYTLLILVVTMVLLSGFCVYKLITLKTGDKWLGLGALILYFIIQGRFSAFTSDSNIAVFSSCLVPFFLYFFETKRYLIATFIFILALFARENMALWFIFISVVLIIIHRKSRRDRLYCSGYIILSVVYFIILFRVFIPMIETPEKSYGLFNYSALGANPADALIYLLSNPLNSIKLLFVNHLPDPGYNMVKLEFYIVYIISGGFLLFYRPYYIIWFLPLLAQKMFNDDPIRWSIELHYSIEVATLLPITVFLIIGEFKKVKFRYVFTLVVCVLALGVTAEKFNFRNRTLAWHETSKEAIFEQGFFNTNFSIRNAYKIMKQIPDDAKVCASATFAPHLAQRADCYIFPWVSDAQYIITLKKNDFYVIGKEEFETKYNKYLNDPEWKQIAGDDKIVLLKKIN